MTTRPNADLFDDHGGISQTCSTQFLDYGAIRQFCGPIRTVQCFRDNQLFRALLDEPGDGAVVVVDGGGSLESALMGDIIAAKSSKDGVGAVDSTVEFGGVRFGPATGSTATRTEFSLHHTSCRRA